jgi:hypothetical protein
MKAAHALDYFDRARHDVKNLLPSDSFYAKLRPSAPDQWDKNLFRRVD